MEPRPPTRKVVLATLALHFAGVVLALVFLSTSIPWAILIALALLATAPSALLPWARHTKRLRRVVGRSAYAFVALTYAIVFYLALAWGYMLGWTIPVWGWAVVAATFVLAVVTARPAYRGVRVPLVLPLGSFIAVSLRGWGAEEGLVHCDDLLATRAQSDVDVVMSTTDALDRCVEGEVVPIGRFPRGVWQAPSADRFLVTTQVARGAPPDASSRFTGSLCEVRAGAEPTCVGSGKAQGLAESPALDRVYVASWDQFPGGHRGELLVVPRTDPLALIARVPIENSLAELLLDEEADRVYGFPDQGHEVVHVSASTLTPERSTSAPFMVPGAVQYDASRGEGILCAPGGPFFELDGEPFMSIAIRGRPFTMRPLGSSLLSWVTLTWGCDWDPERRRAYVAIPNLGLLATIDYDSGEVVRSHALGFGIRSVEFDPLRRRLYVTNFLRGEVLAVDPTTGEVLRTWSVGRFPRMMTISRASTELFVGSSLGVVSIRLEEPAR